MGNVFDQFDAEPSQRPVIVIRPQPSNASPVQGNPFDQFDGSPDAAPKEDVGRPAALGVGALKGVTANWADELIGGLTASGMTEALQALPQDQAKAEFQKIQDQGLGPTYTDARDAFRRFSQTAEEQHPGYVLTGELGGSLGIPAGGVARAGLTLGARALRGAVAGGAYGATAGAGAGTDASSRASGAGWGGLFGSLAGGVGAPALEGAVRVIAPMTGIPTVVRMVRGAISPEAEARRRVSAAIARDAQAGSAGLAPAEYQAAQAAGLPVANVDLGGETTRALARSAANTSTVGRSALEELANDRFAGQSDRAATFVDHLFGGGVSADAERQALATGATNTNRVAYAKAYEEGSAGLWSPELERLAGADAVSQAMQRAAKAAKDEAIVNGQGAFNPRVTFTADGRMQLNKGPTGVPTYPDLQYWDLVRRELSDAAMRAGRGTSESRRLNSFARTLNEELDKLVPSYQVAREGAARAFGARDALAAGEQFVTRDMGIDEARRALAQMSPEDRQLFSQGFASRLIQNIQRVGDRVNVLNRIGASPEQRAKLELVLGGGSYQRLDAYLAIERGMDRLRTALGNSTTARQLLEQGLAGGAGYELGALHGGGQGDPANLITATLGVALARGKFHIDERVARRVADLLTSTDPGQLARGIRQVAGNQRLVRAFRDLDVRAMRGATEQAAE